MAFPDVSVLLQNGALGGVNNFAEGVCGFIITGTATGSIALGTPKAVYSFQDVKDLGITSANNPGAWRTMQEFYSMAGDGAECYIMLVANTMTQTQMWDYSSSTGIKVMLDFAQGRIRMAGSVYRPASAGAVTNGLETDVWNAVTNAQTTCTSYATGQMPLRFAIDGRGFTGVAANLTDLTTLTSNRGAIVIGSTTNDLTGSVGLFLGTMAKNPVQRKPSRVRSGALPIAVNSGYVGASSVDTYTQLATMHDKGYIILRKFKPAKSGYYWNGDHTCTSNTDDYSSFARGRIIDKAHVIAYGTFVEEIDEELDVDANNKLLPGVIATIEKNIENAINNTMSSQISLVSAFIDPAQDVIALNKTSVALKIKPKAYNSNIQVKLGF